MNNEDLRTLKGVVIDPGHPEYSYTQDNENKVEAR